MAIPLGSLVRSGQYAGTKNAVLKLPTRSVTRLQRSRPIIRRDPVSWNLGSSRCFSWNPFGGLEKVQSTPHTSKPGIPASSQPPLEEKPSASSPTLSQPREEHVPVTSPAVSQHATDSTAPIPIEASSFADASGSSVLSADAAQNIVATPVSMNYGDMEALGLVNWTPWGIAPWILEIVQVSTNLPWWSVVALATVGARLVALPLNICYRRMRERVAPIDPQLLQIHQELFKSIHDDEKFDRLVQLRRALWSSRGVHPTVLYSMAFGEMAIHLGMFFGILRMCYAPVEQLKVGGLGWLMDLTCPDPYYILPLVATALCNLQISLSRHGKPVVPYQPVRYLPDVRRFFTFVMAPVLAFAPAALNIHVICFVAFRVVPAAVLHIPTVGRRFFRQSSPSSSSSSSRPRREGPSLNGEIITAKNWSSKIVEGPRKLGPEPKSRTDQKKRSRT